ncbi:unnamed protein product [Cylicocyclus nassatus]|uniref:Uncharacterized protein n=1 Tax=Cylicocyclus nassatus TaxID=53992 RepID=A0AA36GQL1_CYLNA|nr:unnamed protein product [Cylicocyclus nassatus]
MHGVYPAALAATATDSKSAGAREDLKPEQARALTILAAGTALLSGVLLVVYYSKRCHVTREGLKPGQSLKAKKGRRSTSSSLRKTDESSRRGSKRK